MDETKPIFPNISDPDLLPDNPPQATKQQGNIPAEPQREPEKKKGWFTTIYENKLIAVIIILIVIIIIICAYFVINRNQEEPKQDFQNPHQGIPEYDMRRRLPKYPPQNYYEVPPQYMQEQTGQSVQHAPKPQSTSASKPQQPTVQQPKENNFDNIVSALNKKSENMKNSMVKELNTDESNYEPISQSDNIKTDPEVIDYDFSQPSNQCEVIGEDGSRCTSECYMENKCRTHYVLEEQ